MAVNTLYAEALCPEEEAELRYGDPRLDANQQPAFDRALERLSIAKPFTDEADLRAEAAEIARRELEPAEAVARRIAEMRTSGAYCYLAFHGIGSLASFVKVGMTRHPEQRLYGLATGNPLDCLWVYVCKAQDSRAAYHIEQRLLRELEPHKRRGEWVSLGQGATAAEAREFAKTMTGIAKSAEERAGDFELFSYGDGRAVA